MIEFECIIDGNPAQSEGEVLVRDVLGTPIARGPDLSPYALNKAVRAARKAKEELDKLSCREICQIFKSAAEFYDDRFDLPISLARGNTLQKVVGARANVQSMLRSFDKIVEHAFSGNLAQSKDGELTASHYHDPVGVVTIIPASTAREIGPWAILSALSVGNAVVVKLDSKEPFSVVELELALRRAGLPAGALNTLFWNTAEKPEMGPRLLQITDKAVLFGWDHTIKEISYHDLKDKVDQEILQQLPIPPHVVAFGTGRSKALLFEVGDIDSAARSLAHGATFAPSECLKVQFVIVQDKLEGEFIRAYQRATKQLVSGTLTHPDTNVGQTTRENQDFVRSVIDDAIRLGAKKILGHDALCEPTLFGDMHEKSLLFREETPAPTLGLITRKTVEEAIELVNSSVQFSESKRSLAVAVYTDSDAIYRQCLMQINACRVTRNIPPIDVDPFSPHQSILLARELTAIKGGR